MVTPSSRTTLKLNTNPKKCDLEKLNLGDVVYLDGVVYTAREGVYRKVLEEESNFPIDLPKVSATNFHCSPAAVQHEDGSFSLGAVSATASFRFSKWVGAWLQKSGAKLIIGKGGMSSQDYREHFVPNEAIYLTTVGYGTGALLGRGVKAVQSIHWKKELGLAQATISQHLKELKSIGLIQGTIEGVSMNYCINHKKWKQTQEQINQLFASYDCCNDTSCC